MMTNNVIAIVAVGEDYIIHLDSKRVLKLDLFDAKEGHLDWVIPGWAHVPGVTELKFKNIGS